MNYSLSIPLFTTKVKGIECVYTFPECYCVISDNDSKHMKTNDHLCRGSYVVATGSSEQTVNLT